MDERKYITALIAERQRRADAGLNVPGGKEAFDFGYAVGVNHGLRLAEKLLVDSMKDEKEKD